MTKNDGRLGKRIRNLHKKTGLTQEQLAEKADMTAKYIQFIETGRRIPSLKALHKIAKALKVKISDFLTF